MEPKRLLYTLATALLAVLSAAAAPFALSSDLEDLDMAIRQSAFYDNAKYARIDSMRIRYQRSPTYEMRIKYALLLGNEYSAFKADSAYAYFTTAYHIANTQNDDYGQKKAKILRIKVLGILGLYTAAINDIKEIESAPLPPDLLDDFYDSARQLYYYMMEYVTLESDFAHEYFELNRHYRDMLLGRLDHNNPLYQIYYAEELEDNGNTVLAKQMLLDMLEEVPADTPLSARILSQLAELASLAGDDEEAAHYMARSAIADVKCSVKENVSLQNLAHYLYGKGDITRAYRYISTALREANFCNARLRNMQIARNMPLINNSYRAQLDSRNNQLKSLLFIMSILFLILVGLFVVFVRQFRRLHSVQEKLKRANSVKEEYIGHFLDLCSIYMERLDSFTKTVKRKVSTGQADDLLKMTKSPKFAEEQNKLFYENFDSAFLHIYPTFVDDFNALLKPEERIEVKNIGELTMELRIFAFLRLGIDDSNKIASFLRYSVNTVYTYRNKIRNKAINRDTFDEDIMRIGGLENGKNKKKR